MSLLFMTFTPGLSTKAIMLLVALVVSILLCPAPVSSAEGTRGLHQDRGHHEKNGDGLDFFYSERPQPSSPADIFRKIYTNHHGKSLYNVSCCV